MKASYGKTSGFTAVKGVELKQVNGGGGGGGGGGNGVSLGTSVNGAGLNIKDGSATITVGSIKTNSGNKPGIAVNFKF